MKVWQVVSSISNEAAGPSYSVPALCRGLVSIGDEVTLATVGSEYKTTSASYTDINFPPTLPNVPLTKKLGLSLTMKSAVAAASHNADVLHLHGLWMLPNCFPIQAIRNPKICRVMTPRGMLDPAALKFSSAKKKLAWVAFQGRSMRAAGLIHVTSEKELIDVRNFGLETPVAIIPNGIEVSKFEKLSEAERGRSIVYLGRLHEKKGLENLIDAWGDLEALHPEWRLDIIGPGRNDYVQALSERIRSKGLCRAVIHEPVFGCKKTQILREAGVTILPSFGENFGMTVAESLAVGTPVITSSFTPWSGTELHKCGWICEPTRASILHTLSAAISTPITELDAMGLRGQSWMRDEFSWSSIAKNMSAAYSWVLGQQDKPDFVICN